ncbi:kinase domain-containing protein [Fusarium pseudoanthophilum]|uniref:non-specific serine/threonine protein kinase n=1 Tax=Fusarium pseudoanthophilum TaxID=48495 RepID=A0A8H5PFU4_9HYPO|nr:kinase domain-containing protein [Fusarium pseudoanthophilum]
MRSVALRHLVIRSPLSSWTLRHHLAFPSGTSPRYVRAATSSSSPVFYLPIEDAESPYGYSPGGYHSIDIGDHLARRYRVVHKLGYGGFSTIWLARDEAALNLREAQDTAHSYMFQLPVARYIAAQMANAVAYIHSRGLVHGAKASDELKLSESKILLADFGTAFYPDRKSRFGSSTPLDICPPEARFEPTTPLSFSADIWTLAHAIWAVMGLRTIFGSCLLSEDDVTQEQVDTLGRLPDEWWSKWDARSRWFMEDGSHKKGRCPEKLEGRFKSSIQDPRRKYGMEILGEKESHAFREMIWWMLSYRPGDRPTAEQLLNTEWMKCWAIPEFENIHK